MTLQMTPKFLSLFLTSSELQTFISNCLLLSPHSYPTATQPNNVQNPDYYLHHLTCSSSCSIHFNYCPIFLPLSCKFSIFNNPFHLSYWNNPSGSDSPKCIPSVMPCSGLSLSFNYSIKIDFYLATQPLKCPFPIHLLHNHSSYLSKT